MNFNLTYLRERFSEKFSKEFFEARVQSLRDVQKFNQFSSQFWTICLVIGIPYILASILSSVLVVFMVKAIFAGKTRVAIAAQEGFLTTQRSEKINSRELKKMILDRNLFNSDGKFPDEKELTAVRSGAGFRLDGPCSAPTLPIELMGTIFLGAAERSLATVREKGYDEADIYKVGDQIYGIDGALVASVERNKLIVNNNGSKECFDLSKNELKLLSNAGGSTSIAPASGGFSGSAGTETTLESSEVERELGPGFGKIIDTARLVPNTNDGGMNGFKIFAIRSGSLLEKVGFKNGDVITQVNDASLKLPEQGFALFQALQDEKEIRIQLLRNGTDPTNLTVRIK